jgi:hypothetical protein
MNEPTHKIVVEEEGSGALQAGKPLGETAEDLTLRRFDEVKRRIEQPSAAGRFFGAGIAL